MKKILSILLISFTLCAGGAFAEESAWIIGDKSAEIQAVQVMLSEQEYYSGECTGLFGIQLQSALIQFQQESGLEATGEINSATLAALGLNSDKSASTVGVVNAATPLKQKASNSATTLAELTADTSAEILSAKSGWTLIRLQSGVEGYIQSKRITACKTGLAKAYDGEIPANSLMCEMRGSDVMLLQERLKSLGYFKQNITGYFGSVTQLAVKKFQAVNALQADGIATIETLQLLFSSNALPGTVTENDELKLSQNATDIELAKQLAEYSKRFLGVPYRSGGNGPNSFDCSGFVKYVFNKFGYTIPRTAYSIGYSKTGKKITKISDLRVGDIVCFDTLRDNDRSDHVGIYLGNNKVIHAGYSSGKILISDMTTRYYKNNFSWGKRIIGIKDRG